MIKIECVFFVVIVLSGMSVKNLIQRDYNRSSKTTFTMAMAAFPGVSSRY